MKSKYRLQQDIAFDKALRAAETTGSLSFGEIKVIVEGVFDGRWISYTMFGKIKSILQRLETNDDSSNKLIKMFVIKDYSEYLLSMTNRRMLAVSYKVDHIPKTTLHNRRLGQLMAAFYLTIHSTGNPNSSAKVERAWLTNTQNDRTASFHVVVDEKQAIECIPFNEVAWHAGDGNGNGNKKSIGLEICESGDRVKTLRNAIKLSARILKAYNLDSSSLRRHHDWATKMCPRILIVAENRASTDHTWEWFIREVDKML